MAKSPRGETAMPAKKIPEMFATVLTMAVVRSTFLMHPPVISGTKAKLGYVVLHVVDAGGLFTPDVRDVLQAWHTTAPAPELYVPIAQYWHAVAPMMELYVPAEQGWHAMVPPEDHEPAEQFWHVRVPEMTAEPAGHDTVVWTAWHVMPPAALVVLAGHAVYASNAMTTMPLAPAPEGG